MDHDSTMSAKLASNRCSRNRPAFPVLLLAFAMTAESSHANPLSLTLRERDEFTHAQRAVEWDPGKTAIIVCDMWDSHHSVTAVRRVNEFAPRLDAVLKNLRERGATVIHSPSDCMPTYAEHPARKRALAAPKATNSPPDMAAWCHRIPSEEQVAYPIDQSDGGEDESEWENDQWAKLLKSVGRNPGTPWISQTPALKIDGETDFIAAEGDVVWNILQQRGVEHVILSGVHTNMCVLGRPFGLRQMVRAKMDTVLLRDCTDVMYNPDRWPYVSHFTGLDLVIGHIEQHVCPTISSDQIVGGQPFRFVHDKRPTLAVVMPKKNASLWRSFTRRFLDADFRVQFTIAESARGSSALKAADVVVLDLASSYRNGELFDLVKKHAASARPLLGVGSPEGALATMFGREGFPSRGKSSTAGPMRLAPFSQSKLELSHPLAVSSGEGIWDSKSYALSDLWLTQGTQVVQLIKTGGEKSPLPAAWTFTRRDSGRSFCTGISMAGVAKDEKVSRLLRDAVYWAADRVIPETLPADPDLRRAGEGWRALGTADGKHSHRDFRTLLKTPSSLPREERILAWESQEVSSVYLNGEVLATSGAGSWKVPAEALRPGDLNLLVFRTKSAGSGKAVARLETAPSLGKGEGSIRFDRVHWQERFTDDETPDTAFPIPPQFGAPTDLIQNWVEAKR